MNKLDSIKFPEKIRALVFEEWNGEKSVWVGQCLEYDIGSQFANKKEMRYQLELAIVSNMAVAIELESGIDSERDLFEGLPSAPKKFFDLWDATSDNDEQITKLTFTSEILKNWKLEN